MSQPVKMTVILGASSNPERYSYLVMKTLEEKQFPFYLVNPAYKQIEGHSVASSLGDLPGAVHTVTMYISPERQGAILPDIIKIKPERVIFNPGSESENSIKVLENAGISCFEACSLVLLKTGQYFSPAFEKKTNPT